MCKVLILLLNCFFLVPYLITGLVGGRVGVGNMNA